MIHDLAGEIVVLGPQLPPLEVDHAVAVVADIDASSFGNGRLSTKSGGHSWCRKGRSGLTIDRHPAVAEASAVRHDSAAERMGTVDNHAVLVPPEPDDRPLDELGELLRGLEVPLVESRVVLMVAQEHDAAIVAARAELHVITQPLDQRVLEPARRPQDVLDDWPADRVVARVERDHAPVVVLEAEEARLLPAPRRMHAHLREQELEIGIAERVHLVVAVQREAAHSARRPRARRVVVVGIVDP